MKKRIISIVVGVLTIGVFTAAAMDASASGSTASARSKLTIMAPAAPGGGWDGFGREAQQGLRRAGIVNNAQVINVPGAGGTIGLSKLVQMDGRDDMLMVTGAVMIGASVLSKTSESLADTTPIARLADDYSVLVVPAASPYNTMAEFVEAWQKAPGAHSIAGGSLGSIDHLLSGLLGRTVGITPSAVNYVAYSGGGEVLASMLSNTAAAGISGYNEFRDQIEAGTLRALGISSPERLDGVPVPTFIESGIDVQMSNWRGYVAPPGIADDARDEMVAIITELHQTDEWADTLRRNNWTDSFQVGDEFDAFLEEETTRVSDLIRELGL
ncbi:tripartite tricarboxylate transporter substrate binding protein [Mycetocola tolaasinivorans]|uniref:Tripartite tricarboxylate transporter substrate binding protein n=1 Tax=Mycetocola tolaasinivorans TaxID=76635 RepID=A0A3L7AEH2_9MICO|nr:tripartite tricarboxylate transporter substrate-binding protein [Mycetocola tolaasinivorans]RLP77792.1 tripartite tricarboxylate transporter substrate binding protein [Mycetocola tolaasinivorans]